MKICYKNCRISFKGKRLAITSIGARWVQIFR